MPDKQPQMDSWAIRFTHFVNKFGTIKVSLIFVIVALLFTMAASYIFRMQVSGETEIIDFLGAIILTMLSAPWVIYFFSELVKQLEQSRNNLKEVVAQLERLREEDVLLNRELHNNIKKLNHEIEQRRQAQMDRETVFEDLEKEIKERTEKEQQSTRLSLLLRSIIDASPDLIYYRNPEGKFAGCNKVAEEMTGKTESELIGLTPHEVYEQELADGVVASDNEILANNEPRMEEVWLKFSDGRRRYYEMLKVPFFDNDGICLGLLSFGRDITERQQAEAALAKASKDKTAFIATISHELRTPLNGIVGLSRMLRDTELNKQQFAWISTIYASATALGNIFNDIIDLDKMDRDKLELALKTVKLKDFIDELGSIFELFANDKGLNFEVKVVEPLPRYVEADGTRLRQILWNLLFNSMKFTPSGSVQFIIEASEPTDNISNLTFKIADTGIGIPEKDLNNVFAMYYQVDDPSHQTATGTGIGLAICQEMVGLMNGNISVHSVVGEGTCFSVDLPLTLCDAPPTRAELKVSDLDILLVEDIELNVMVAKALLEKLGQKVDVAMTGEEALEKARKHEYDLILLDIQLPGINGFEVAEILREEELVPATPIVALTANVIKTRDEYLQNGMDDIISKPIKKTRLIDVFNRLFCDEKEVTITQTVPIQERESVLDIELLTMLTDTIGPEMIVTSVGVLKEKMPEYMEILLTSLSAEEKGEVCSQAHKIKGAAGSVGMSRVQKTANKIQQGDHPAWWQNIQDWVEELQFAYEKDIVSLEDWISERS